MSSVRVKSEMDKMKEKMDKNCTISQQDLIKYFFYFTNFAFFALGTTLLVFGVLGPIAFRDILFSFYFLVNVIEKVLFVGILSVITSFIGWRAAVKDNKRRLYIYSFLMAMMIGVKLWTVTSISRNQNSYISDNLNYYFNDKTDFANFYEVPFRCCGTSGPEAYGHKIPDHCCGYGLCTIDNSLMGCNEVIGYYFEDIRIIIVNIMYAGVFVEIMALMLSLIIARKPREKHTISLLQDNNYW